MIKDYVSHGNLKVVHVMVVLIFIKTVLIAIFSKILFEPLNELSTKFNE